MWYRKPYVNRRAWLLDQFEALNLTHEQLVILLVIDLANETNQSIDMEYLQKKTKLSSQDLDRTLHELMESQIVKIETQNQHIHFNIDGIFGNNNPYEDVQHDLLNRFESEFGRPLSQQELLALNNLSKQYDENLIIYGLRQAILNNKLSMNYVDKVVRSKK